MQEAPTYHLAEQPYYNISSRKQKKTWLFFEKILFPKFQSLTHSTQFYYSFVHHQNKAKGWLLPLMSEDTQKVINKSSLTSKIYETLNNCGKVFILNPSHYLIKGLEREEKER